MDWQSLIKDGNTRLGGPNTANSSQGMERESIAAPAPPSFGAAQGNSTFGGNAQAGHYPFAPQIDPQLEFTQPPATAAPRQAQIPGNISRSTSQFDQQHATRIFGQQHDPKSTQLQKSMALGPLPAMPTYESQAHKTLRQMAPKLQALLDLFAVAYETHDLEKVEELRKRLSWAIDAKGN